MYVKVMLTLLVALAAVIAVLLGRPPAPPDPLAARVEVPNPLNTVIDELKLKDLPLEQAVEVLRRKTGANIVVNWNELAEPGIDKTRSVEANLRGVTLLAALRVLFDQSPPVVEGQHGESALPPYGCAFDGGVVTVYGAHARPGQLLVRTYDVRDLLEDGYHPPGPLQRSSDSGSGEAEDDGAAGRLSRLAELVRSDPGWADPQWSGTAPAGAVTPGIHRFAGRLIVVQTAERQRNVKALLRELRRAR